MTKDGKDNPLDEMLEAGADAMMAGMLGDEEGWHENIRKGRKAYTRLREQQGRAIDQFVAEEDAEAQRKRKQKQRKHRPPHTPKVATSLGDLLKASGVKAVDAKDGDEG